MQRKERKAKWAIEKPKLVTARRLLGIFFIEPRDENFNNIMTNARKLKIPMPAMKTQDANAAVEKRNGNIGENSGMAADES